MEAPGPEPEAVNDAKGKSDGQVRFQVTDSEPRTPTSATNSPQTFKVASTARQSVVQPLVDYFEYQGSTSSELEDLNQRIDTLWLAQEKLSIVIEVCDRLINGELDDLLTGDSEEDVAVVRCEMEELALNCLNVTMASRGKVSLSGGFKQLENVLMEVCETEAEEFEEAMEKLAEPESKEEALLLIAERREKCKQEFHEILAAKTAKAEEMEDMQEHSEFLRHGVQHSLQNILERLAADPDVADVQSKGCMWLAALAASGADDRRSIVCFGGVQALMQAIELHTRDTDVQLNGCRALCLLAEEGTTEQTELAAVGEAVEAALAAEYRLGHEQELLAVALKAVANLMSGCECEEVLEQMHDEMEPFPAVVRGPLFAALFGETLGKKCRSGVGGGLSRMSTTKTVAARRLLSYSTAVSSGRTPALDSLITLGKYQEVKDVAERKLQEFLGETDDIANQKASNHERLCSLGCQMVEAQGPESEGSENWKSLCVTRGSNSATDDQPEAEADAGYAPTEVPGAEPGNMEQSLSDDIGVSRQQSSESATMAMVRRTSSEVQRFAKKFPRWVTNSNREPCEPKLTPFDGPTKRCARLTWPSYIKSTAHDRPPPGDSTTAENPHTLRWPSMIGRWATKHGGRARETSTNLLACAKKSTPLRISEVLKFAGKTPSDTGGEHEAFILSGKTPSNVDIEHEQSMMSGKMP